MALTDAQSGVEKHGISAHANTPSGAMHPIFGYCGTIAETPDHGSSELTLSTCGASLQHEPRVAGWCAAHTVARK